VSIDPIIDEVFVKMVSALEAPTLSSVVAIQVAVAVLVERRTAVDRFQP
jgi:hypothetical protein